ncbi:MAG: hypothetical protein GY696_31125 [Gammaproteobacteria bacterium]|nr:hypothetical protein [Gammaproteobacteria bacterium]
MTNTKSPPTNHIETTDLFKGAFLLCMGGSLTGSRVTYNGRKTVAFLITGTDLDRHNEAYIADTALVSPRKLENALNHLRDLLFNTLREKERTHHDRKQKNPTGSHQSNQDRHRHYHPNPIQRHSLKEKR